MRINVAPWLAVWLIVVGLAACKDPPVEPPSPPVDPWSTSPGLVVWSVPGSGWLGPPAVDEHMAYFGGRTHSLTAVWKDSGKVAWRATTPETSGFTIGFGVVAAGEVVVLPDNGLYAFDRSSGHLRWTLPNNGQQPGWALPWYESGVVFAGSFGGEVTALDASSGRVIWRIPPLPGVGQVAAGEPRVGDGVLYVSYASWASERVRHGGVGAYDAATGQLRWLRLLDAQVGTTDNPGVSVRVVPFGDGVFASTLSGHVFALRKSDGATLWVSRAADVVGAGGDVRQLEVVAGTLVVAANRGIIEGLDPATGARRWATSIGGGSPTGRVLTGDDKRVYITTAGGQLTAIQATDGAIVWENGQLGSHDFIGEVAVDQRAVYIGGNSRFFALKR